MGGVRGARRAGGLVVAEVFNDDECFWYKSDFNDGRFHGKIDLRHDRVTIRASFERGHIARGTPFEVAYYGASHFAGEKQGDSTYVDCSHRPYLCSGCMPYTIFITVQGAMTRKEKTAPCRSVRVSGSCMWNNRLTAASELVEGSYHCAVKLEYKGKWCIPLDKMGFWQRQVRGARGEWGDA